MSLPIYATTGQKIWYYTFRVICGLIFFYLIAPIFVILPLSFSSGQYFTFTDGMFGYEKVEILGEIQKVFSWDALKEGYSLQHYRDMLGPEFFAGGGNAHRGLAIGLVIAAIFTGLSYFSSDDRKIKLKSTFFMFLIFGIIGLVVGKIWGLSGEWITPIKNSFKIAIPATIVSVSLGTLAAIGLTQSHVPFKKLIMAILISPMIVPLVISALGMYFFYAPMGNFLTNTFGLERTYVEFIKVILAHAVLGIPFVIITVTATLSSFDRSLTRAAANMGAGPMRTFFKVQMPLILPGMISGGLFAFITSFDEVVVVIFIGSQKVQTLPWQMFTGLREQISLTILAVATMLVVFSIALLVTLELLRRRSERLRGMSPG